MLDQPVKKNGGKPVIKIIDWGTSAIFTEEQMKSRIGTAFYIAPEVLKKCYTEKCDIWSIGIILYILLWGYPPFKGKNEDEIIQSVLTDELVFPQEEWMFISDEAKDLICHMLKRDD